VQKKSTYKKKARDEMLVGLWCIGSVKKPTITEFASMGGRVRPEKLSKERELPLQRRRE
jgi:hypothetical protein